MTIIICALGALVGLVVAVVCRKLALPMVLRSQEAHTREGNVRILGIPLREMTIFVYRFVFPFVFAVVGAVAAYRLFVGDLR